jgi:transcriptional regulator with XRE-family HTH domain
MAAGISQAATARAAGLSASQLGRLERGEIERPSLEQVCRGARVLGLAASVRLYPAGQPVRDSAQLALLDRFERRLAPPLRLRREVPLPIQDDLRAWDGMVESASHPFAIEGESHIRDVQALERKIALKLRDDPRVRLVVLVATRSEHNRRVIAEHRESLRALFPLDGGAVLRALAAGRPPSAGGIVLI